MSATVPVRTPRHDAELAEVPEKRTEPAQLPTFRGGTYVEHVEAWQLAHAEAQRQTWMLAAIAASLERSVGGAPSRHAARQPTVIQRFCRDVGIERQTFYRLTHTYRTFAETRNTGGTRFIAELSFKHYEVASRAPHPAAAVGEAHERGWSANELARQLTGQRAARPFSLDDEVESICEYVTGRIKSWPEGAGQHAPEVLQEIFQKVLDDLHGFDPAPLTAAESHAIRWIKAELESLPFVKRTFTDVPVGRGGSVDVVAGAAGAPIYHSIVGNTSRATRRQVLDAVNNVLKGKLTSLGRRVLDVARELAQGRLTRLMRLPPEAGGRLSGTLFWGRGTLFERIQFDDDLPPCMRELTASDDDDPIGRRDEEERMALASYDPNDDGDFPHCDRWAGPEGPDTVRPGTLNDEEIPF
jgi:hypothetical protein